jgi:inhibitor of KinA
MESLEPLGDQGILARFPDEPSALAWAQAVRALPVNWVLDVVQAYTSVAVFHDLGRITHAEAQAFLGKMPASFSSVSTSSRLHVIPCCYERQLDLERIVEHTHLAAEEVIRLHSSGVYTIFAIGFCPGFPYLGYLPSGLCGIPRLESPRLRVEPGSVGLTGRQTGIYTEPRPGGWNLVGQTPLVLVDVAEGYFPLRTGDRVKFERIDERAFRELAGERL